MKSYYLQQVKPLHLPKHTKWCLWASIYNHIRPFLSQNISGKDATNDFEDVGHSDSAREMMEKYYIGEIDASTVPQKRTYIPPQQAPYNHDKTPEFLIKILQFLVPLLILGLAFAVRHFTKKE